MFYFVVWLFVYWWFGNTACHEFEINLTCHTLLLYIVYYSLLYYITVFKNLKLKVCVCVCVRERERERARESERERERERASAPSGQSGQVQMSPVSSSYITRGDFYFTGFPSKLTQVPWTFIHHPHLAACLKLSLQGVEKPGIVFDAGFPTPPILLRISLTKCPASPAFRKEYSIFLLAPVIHLEDE